MTTPRTTSGPSPEDDPTGVRALLSSLPEPGPMPAYLVERISASLAAEQAHRTRPDPQVVTPLAASLRRRRSAPRVILGLAGAAAAVAVIGIVGSGLLNTRASNDTTASAGANLTTASRDTALSEGGEPSREGGGPAAKADGDAAYPELRMRSTKTDYGPAGFADQARALTASAAPASAQSTTGSSSPGDRALTLDESGPLATPAGLADCLRGLGVSAADVVVADLATYDGRPAAVIVATRAGRSTAYAVGRDCTHAKPSLLHSAVPLR